uniref:Uncharacterized protein n=1 Tax=Lutzomyia longipalpis TaxID=7200 RepID=A0A7G3B877_LUTLO
MRWFILLNLIVFSIPCAFSTSLAWIAMRKFKFTTYSERCCRQRCRCFVLSLCVWRNFLFTIGDVLSGTNM